MELSCWSFFYEIGWVKASIVFPLTLVLVVGFKSYLKLLLIGGDSSFLQFWTDKPDKKGLSVTKFEISGIQERH